MPLFARFRLGDGRLDPKLLAKLEAEGLVIAEEGLRGTVSYDHFKAPGKRFNGKVSGERIGLGVSEHRVAAYCRSGTVKLVDTEYDNPRLRAVDFLVEDEKLAIVVDYDELGEGDVSGKITIRARTPRAGEFANAINSRLAR